MLKISEYQPALLGFLQHSMTELQRYLIKTDPLQELYLDETYSHLYTADLLRRVQEQQGKVLIAFKNESPCGMIAGIIVELEPHDQHKFDEREIYLTKNI